jgi:hypothetical protein
MSKCTTPNYFKIRDISQTERNLRILIAFHNLTRLDFQIYLFILEVNCKDKKSKKKNVKNYIFQKNLEL